MIPKSGNRFSDKIMRPKDAMRPSLAMARNSAHPRERGDPGWRVAELDAMALDSRLLGNERSVRVAR